MRVNLEFLRQSDLKKKPKPAFGRKSEKSLKSVFWKNKPNFEKG